MRTIHINNKEIKYNIGKSFINIIKDSKRYNLTKDYVRGEPPKLTNEASNSLDLMNCDCGCGWNWDELEDFELALVYKNRQELSPAFIKKFVINNL